MHKYKMKFTNIYIYNFHIYSLNNLNLNQLYKRLMNTKMVCNSGKLLAAKMREDKMM